MTYVSWGVMYEGDTDAAYFDVLIPRLMDSAILERGTRYSTIPNVSAIRLKRGSINEVAREACAAREAFHLVFIHGDTGGRGLERGLDGRLEAYCEAMTKLCDWRPARCITIAPRQETEAWILVDPQAVMSALGFRGSPMEIGLPRSPAEVERLSDPKAVLESAAGAVRGRRRRFDPKDLFAAIAQHQSLEALRQTRSFITFENNVLRALADLGCIALQAE